MKIPATVTRAILWEKRSELLCTVYWISRTVVNVLQFWQWFHQIPHLPLALVQLGQTEYIFEARPSMFTCSHVNIIRSWRTCQYTGQSILSRPSLLAHEYLPNPYLAELSHRCIVQESNKFLPCDSLTYFPSRIALPFESLALRCIRDSSKRRSRRSTRFNKEKPTLLRELQGTVARCTCSQWVLEFLFRTNPKLMRWVSKLFPRSIAGQFPGVLQLG